MYQAQLVQSLIAAPSEIVGLVTEGDNQRIALTGSTSGLFVSRLRDGLLESELDVLVHSLKDLPTAPDSRFVIGALPERVEVNDVFIGHEGATLAELPEGSVVGTSSPRRAAWVKRQRPDLEVAPIRGNVETRLAKVSAGDFGGTLLAAAGLRRLGLFAEWMQEISPSDLIPAPGQGAIAVECRSDSAQVIELLRPLDKEGVRLEVSAEREVLNSLSATCATAAGAHAILAEGGLTLIADVAAADNGEHVRVTRSANVKTPDEATQLGREVANELRELGAEDLMARA